MSSVVIVDYGLGNLFSVQRALNKIGVSDSVISSEKAAIENADRLILPGVGAFGDGMDNLRKRDLVSSIRSYAESGRPLLGVCLGMQLIMSESEEFGVHEGLNLVPGRVVRLQAHEEERAKIPQIGWNSLHAPDEKSSHRGPWNKTVLSGVEEGAFMYFLHSYMVVPHDSKACLATTQYGGNRFCSVLRQGNMTGVQFHPERSGPVGLRIYRNFVLGT